MRKRGVFQELTRLSTLLDRALTETAEYWPALRRAYAWVHQAARLLNNEAQRPADAVRREYRGLLAQMLRERDSLGSLAPAVPHFLKVTRSYWLGLFRCDEVPELPRTNNDLEQLFGSARYHERRASGRRGAAPGMVVRGAARVVAAIATRHRPYQAEELRPRKVRDWQQLRAQLEGRRETRRRQLRFRRDPGRYLAELERVLIHPSLPP